ncbi:MAG: hypothetical protein ABF311_04560 [Polaribacter sp.]|jgi:hypothetical protein
MKNIKKSLFILLLIPTIVRTQAIEIVSYGENALVVSLLTVTNLIVNYKYKSKVGSFRNHLFIGLEILVENNNYVSYATGKTLEKQTFETNKTGIFSLGSSNKPLVYLTMVNYYQDCF